MKNATRYQPAAEPTDSLLPKWRVKAIGIGLAVGAVLFAIGDYTLVWGTTDAVANMRTQLAALESDNGKIEAMVEPSAYEAFKQQCAEEEKEFQTALEAVPSEAELAAALKDLENVMGSTGVNMIRFTPGPAPAKPAPAPAPDATPGKPGEAPAPPQVQISARPIEVEVAANFRSYQALLNALAGNQRLLTVEGFTMSTLPGGSDARSRVTLKAKLALKGYFKQIPEAATPPAKS